VATVVAVLVFGSLGVPLKISDQVKSTP